MVPIVRRAVVSFALILPAVAPGPARAADVPEPTEAEVAKFLAVEKAIVSDTGNAAAICGEMDSAKASDSDASSDPAVVGRRLDASPVFGPLLRRNGISGKRFTEVSIHVAAAGIGLGIADQADAAAVSRGKPAVQRAELLAKSPTARIVAAHEQEMTALGDQMKKLCGGDSDDEDAGDPED